MIKPPTDVVTEAIRCLSGARHVLRLHAARPFVDQRHCTFREAARRLREAEGGGDGPGVEDSLALPQRDRIEPEVESVEHVRGQ